ncbi:Very-long-chain (3R)-3-hydroxyacyl-CoA dehydratase [Willisornis vidua]|uniref:Very-long-chain (3R)-3-hydroxyacyl-CoA dehydratase n=1 Tax=Willisornis vidua TaxID=1566151 RepID=A0ABQ9CY53_9PASS|nr:Very-long-chain (3R)-3-hydroxyacyl-CoA dehydratase [Willisornis vidua]
MEQNPDITITDNVLHFRAQGHGAKGDNIYEFEIEFLEPVEPKPVCRVTQRQLNITVQKKESNWWERLTKQEKRPLFLAPDFDRWLDESDAEMELKEKEEEKINKMKIESRVPKDHSFYDTFHTISDMMYFCETLALMEIMNSLIGLVRAPLIPTVVQICGRNFVLFVILGSLEEMQSKPVVFFVFYFWSITELFRGICKLPSPLQAKETAPWTKEEKDEVKEDCTAFLSHLMTR